MRIGIGEVFDICIWFGVGFCMFYPTTYGHEAPRNTKVNQTLKCQATFHLKYARRSKWTEKQEILISLHPFPWDIAMQIITCTVILKISYLSRFGWAMITMRNESHGIGIVHYGHFPVKDPTWSLNVHSSKGCQAMNLTWKHDSHVFAGFILIPSIV